MAESKPDPTALNFEDALKELEEIVSKLEGGQVSLEQSISMYERGEILKRRCEALLKATQVDGVYSADPETTPQARRYDRLTYDDVLKQNLRIMDGAAIALARDNGIPIIVFSIKSQGGLAAVLRGTGASTTIESEKSA